MLERTNRKHCPSQFKNIRQYGSTVDVHSSGQLGVFVFISMIKKSQTILFFLHIFTVEKKVMRNLLNHCFCGKTLSAEKDI